MYRYSLYSGKRTLCLLHVFNICSNLLMMFVTLAKTSVHLLSVKSPVNFKLNINQSFPWLEPTLHCVYNSLYRAYGYSIYVIMIPY